MDNGDASAVIMSDGEEMQSFQPEGGPNTRKKIHVCPICNKSYTRPSRLKEHMKIHVEEKLYVCSSCNKAFSTSTNLRAHEKIHEADKPHPCSICPKRFLRPGLLKKHLRIHVQDGLIAEPTTNGTSKEFWSDFNVEEEEEGDEKEEDADGQLDTSDCFTSEPKCDNDGDPNSEKGSVSDNEDDKTENEEGDVSGLINSDGEEENWTPIVIDQNGCPESQVLNNGKPKTCCPVCGRDCHKASALVKHLRTHSGERPYQCPTCGKSFTQQVHMTEHQRIHTGEKPYICTLCEKSFSFSSALRRHQRLHTNDRPYQCSVCQKTFKQQSSLKSHELIHAGVRHHCLFCDKSFSRALELTYHVGVHSEGSPYFCNICKKNLGGARIFRNHMKKHKAKLSSGPQEAEAVSLSDD